MGASLVTLPYFGKEQRYLIWKSINCHITKTEIFSWHEPWPENVTSHLISMHVYIYFLWLFFTKYAVNLHFLGFRKFITCCYSEKLFWDFIILNFLIMRWIKASPIWNHVVMLMIMRDEMVGCGLNLITFKEIVKCKTIWNPNV